MVLCPSGSVYRKVLFQRNSLLFATTVPPVPPTSVPSRSLMRVFRLPSHGIWAHVRSCTRSPIADPGGGACIFTLQASSVEENVNLFVSISAVSSCQCKMGPRPFMGEFSIAKLQVEKLANSVLWITVPPHRDGEFPIWFGRRGSEEL